jgi:hypothetical protein
LQITAAFWFQDEEEDWKLVVVSSDVEEKGPNKLYTMIALMLKELAIDTNAPLQFPFDRIILVNPHSLLYRRVKQNADPVGGPVREGPALDSYIYKMD